MKRFICLLGLLLCAVPVTAAPADDAVKLTVDVSPRTGTLLDMFIMTVVVDSSSQAGFPYLTGGDDFRLSLIKPTRERVQDGSRSRELVTYQYRLFPKRTGNLKTPAVELELADRKLFSPGVAVTVESPREITARGDQTVFLIQDSDRRSVFVGEQLHVTLELYSRVPLKEPKLEDNPPHGFWREQFGRPQQLERDIGEHRYQVLRLKTALYPLRDGVHHLPAQTLRARTAATEQPKIIGPSWLDRFSPSLPEELFPDPTTRRLLEVSSNEVRVEVRSLPDPPADLKNWDPTVPLVGKTVIQSRCPETQFYVGENAEFQAVIQSEGNLNPLKALPWDLPPEIKAYQEPPQRALLQDRSRLRISKKFSVSLIPTVAGSFRIPAVEIPYFDPEQSSYRYAKTEPCVIEVLERDGVPESTSAVTPSFESAEGLPPEGPAGDISRTLRYREPSLIGRWLEGVGWLTSLFLLTAMLLLFLTTRLVVTGWSRSYPIKDLKKRLRLATTPIALEREFKALLVKRFILKESGGETIRAEVRREVRDSDLAFAIVAALDELEFLRFGGRAASPRQFAELHEKLIGLTEEW